MPLTELPSATEGARVSIAMATYNGADHLGEQLRSIAAQTLLPAELVVSDDGSTDHTLAVIREFAREAAFPVRILEKTERLGYADNFLFAVEHCRHNLIAMCDQDDRWLPHKLQTAVARMSADRSLLSLHRLIVADGSLEPQGVFDQGIHGDARFDALQLDPYRTGWGNTMLFRREVAHLVPRAGRPRHFEETFATSHDTWIYVLSAALGAVSHIAEPLILYRQHGANVYGVQPSRRIDRWRDANRRFWTVPMGVHRERVQFNQALVPLLHEAGRTDHPLAAEAAHAAEAIAARTSLLRQRLAVYEGASVGTRLSAFRSLLHDRRAGASQQMSVVSLAKDFVLGVLGLGHHR